MKNAIALLPIYFLNNPATVSRFVEAITARQVVLKPDEISITDKEFVVISVNTLMISIVELDKKPTVEIIKGLLCQKIVHFLRNTKSIFYPNKILIH